ncbi:MAG TPA: sugar isomerase [Verrucomicrobiae bacterium]|jgi:L-fucose isomerase-like protein
MNSIAPSLQQNGFQNASLPEQHPKLGVIFLGRRRPGFDMEWGRRMEEKVRAWLKQSEFTVFEPAEKAVDDRSLRRAVSACESQNAEAIVLLQTTMSDGRLCPTMAQLWPDPVVLWATPEKQEGDMISSCSLVGAHCWASVFRQLGHSFDLVYGDPGAAETRQRFGEAVRLAAALRRLRTVRLGSIGGQAPGYFAMGADPFAVQRGLGAQVQTFSLVEFGSVLNDLSGAAVEEDVAKVKAMGIPYKDTTEEDLPMASRMYLTMQSFMDNENLDALTIRCWPEMPNTFGQWPYLGVARLADEGRAIAMEGDADGVLTAWIGRSLGFGRCYLSDWLEHDEHTITTWHVGAAPMSMCPPPGSPGGPRLARHFNIKKPLVVESTLRSDMPATLARFWRCDGKYLLTAREGRTIPPRRHLMATNSLMELASQDPRSWFEELCHEGMPHHVALFEGLHETALRRMARVMGIKFI